jgi:glycosyltransferase involved in cell wall biosynthesis
MPGWIGAIGGALALRRRKPLGVYLGGDWRETGRYNPRLQGPSFAKAAAARVYPAAVGAIQSGIVRRAQLVLVHGPALYARYERLNRPGHRVCRVAPVLSVSETDVHVREDTCEDGRVRLLYVGELLPVKGVDVLIRACASLAGGPTAFSLRIAGEGPDRAKLAALADRLGLRDRVTFEGYVPNGDALWRLYRESDVFVLPSLSEGFPRVIYEAMSQGLPVVATSADGIAAELVGGVDAMLVPPGDEGALAEGLRTLSVEPGLRRRLIHNGYERTARLFERMRAESPAALLERFLKPLV